MGSLGPNPARTLVEAVTAFFERQQQAASCVTATVLVGRGYYPAPDPFTMAFGSGDTRLGRNGEYLLRVRHGYRFARAEVAQRGWLVVTTSYEYQLMDRAERMILTYHCHPSGRSPVTAPHLHVGCRVPLGDFAKVHLPTGHVSLPAVIQMTINELGVEPLRPDWDAVLSRAERELAG